MADNLKQRAVSGVAWSSFHKFSIVFLGFISGIVLARLLTPHDYGVIGMLTIFLSLSNTLIDGGFGSALIQKKNPTNEDYSTILYWNIGFSIFLYGVLYIGAPFIARFYNLTLLTDVLRVQGLIIIINAARIVQRTQLRKQLMFKKIAIINCSANAVALLVTIYLAWKKWGVWALVFQQLLVGVLTTLLYWFTSKWKPLWAFSKQSFKELFNFGGFILLSNLFNTFCNNIQGLLIGKVFNASILGYYTKAQRTESYSSTLISSVLDQVSYPVLSEAQNDKSRMIRVLRQFVGTSAFITFPLMMLLILLAKPIFLFLYSERWISSVPYFQILCLAGIAVCLQNVNYYAVAALGKSKVLLRWTFIKRLLGLLLIVIGLLLYGMYGLLIGSVIASWTIYIINAYLASKYVGYTLRLQFFDLLPIIVISLIAFVVSYSIEYVSIKIIFIKYIIQFVIFVGVYISISSFLKIKSLDDAKSSLSIIGNKLYNK